MPPSAETFAYRQTDKSFEAYITVPTSLAEGLPHFIPDEIFDAVGKGLPKIDDDDWEWRGMTKKTAEKKVGLKIDGSKHAVFIWGYIFNKKHSIKKVQRYLPFETKEINFGGKISAVPTIISVK